MTTKFRLLVVAAAVWGLAGIPSSAPAQFDDGPFAGFAMDAWGASFSMIYDDPNGPIPAHPTGEMHAAYGLASMTDGSGHGVASEFWPGPTAATAGPFVEDSFWDGVEEGSEGQFPPPQLGRPALTPKQWPTAAEVFEPAGPHTQDVPPNAHAHSAADVVFAKASTVPLSLPGIFTADGGATSAESKVGTIKNASGAGVDAVRSNVVTTATDIAILGGLVKMDKVTTTATVTSDGQAAVTSGRTVVSGLTIRGEGYTIDKDGIHAGGQTNPDPITGQLNNAAQQALKDSGISMTLTEAIDTVKGAEGARSAGGLVIRVNSERLDEFVSQLPDPIEQQMRANLSTTHDLVLIFGAANVRSSALEAFAFDADELDFDADFGDDTSVLGTSVDSGSFGDDVAVPFAGPTGGTTGSGAVINSRPAFSGPIEVEGVSAAIVLFGLALVLGAARGLRGLSDTLLGAGAATSCPLESER